MEGLKLFASIEVAAAVFAFVVWVGGMVFSDEKLDSWEKR